MSTQSRYHNQNPKSTLIVVENGSFLLDTRVQKESFSLRDAGWVVNVLCPFRKQLEGDNVTHANFWQAHNKNGVFVNYYPLPFADTGFIAYLAEYLAAFYWIALRSWHIWRKAHFRVIHFCNPPDIFFPIAFFYRFLGVRVIFDHHDLFPELISARFKETRGRLLYWFARMMEFLTFRAAHIVITTNHSFQQIAVTRGKYPSDRIFIVRNGPKLADFIPLEPEPSLKCGFAKMVVYAGVMGYQDGVLDFLDSIQYLVQNQKRHDILFVLLGDGAVRSIFSKHAKDLGIDCIQMPGMIRDNRLLRQYLSTADVLVSPEPYNELNENSTFIKVGEYMAMGKSIVAYDLRETRYTAQEAALYVPHGDKKAFADAILQLLDQPELRTQLEEAAKTRIRELSWENQLPNLLSAYETVLKKNNL